MVAGHMCWLIRPELVPQEVYLASASSKLCEFISLGSASAPVLAIVASLIGCLSIAINVIKVLVRGMDEETIVLMTFKRVF